MVNKRTKVLQAAIQRIVHPGSIIYSDEWKSYNGYHHQTVNHSKAFVRDEGTHSNSLESLHNELKLELKIQRTACTK